MISDESGDGKLRLYGRRSGRRLRKGRQALVDSMLPRIRLELPDGSEFPDIAAHFSPRSREVWLEVGFGAGEHIAAQAQSHPDTGFIGCEPFMEGVANLLSHIDRGELAKIRKKDIDRSGEVWFVELSQHKTTHRGKRRTIYFGPKAQSLLLPRLVCGDDDLIFPLRRDSYRRAVHRACKRAGVQQWSPSQLRHTSGTAVREKMGLEAAQVHLGHARCDVTQVYAETSQAKAIEVARRMG